MKGIKTIVSFMTLAACSWGQTCSAPTPVFTPPTIPTGETQPLELNGFVRTALTIPSVVMATDIYGATGYPWKDCKELVFTRITETDTFLAISTPTGGDYLIYETGLTAKQTPTIVNQWSMKAANLQTPITGQQPLIDWNHDAIRLPNGWTAIIGDEEMMVTSPTQCLTSHFPTNYCDVMGAKIVVMDSAGTVQWVWDSFDASQFPYLSRRAVLGETCTPTGAACKLAMVRSRGRELGSQPAQPVLDREGRVSQRRRQR